MRKRVLSITIISAIFLMLSLTAIFAYGTSGTLTKTTIDGKEYYQIYDEDDLYAFAKMVNDDTSSNTPYNAVLENNITVNSNVLKSDGSLNTDKSSTFDVWTPIGKGGTNTENTAYGGIFDGQGHTISGLYYNQGGSDVGFFGAINRFAHIKNLGITDSYFESGTSVGGLVGYAYADESDAAYIEDCFSTATVKGTYYIGVLCGNSETATIKNSFAAGKYYATNTGGAFCGVINKAADDHCYALEPDTSKQGKSWGVNYCDESVFASGEAAYGLDNGRGKWGQKIGTDDLPKIDGEKVYYNYYGTKPYHNHNTSDSYCSNCGAMTTNSKGTYEIKTMDNLYWFADLVNKGTTSAKAVLKNDITVTGSWTAIGNGNGFSGSFDGNKHTVTMNGGSLFGSIASSGTVKTLGVSGGSLCSGDNEGTIENCYAAGGSNIAVKLCDANKGTIKSSYAAGGNGTAIYASNDGGTVTSCYTLACSAASASDGSSFSTSSPFSSGEVAYKLNEVGGVWGQKIETDTLPALGGESVYFAGSDSYHNHNKGYCTLCNHMPTYDASKGGWQIGTEDELYWFAKYVNGEITLSDGKTYTQNAVLTADICVNENLLPESGELPKNYRQLNLTEWTPIGVYDSENADKTGFSGTFNGQNHTISGIYCTYGDGYGEKLGFFGRVNGGTVQNLKIIDSYFWGMRWLGGICGWNAGGLIENCYADCTVSAVAAAAGGICGCNCGSIQNCTNAGSIGYLREEGYHYSENANITNVGGICAENSGIITECINLGAVGVGKINAYTVGGIAGINSYEPYDISSKIQNCINVGSVTGYTGIGGICGANYGDCYDDSSNLPSYYGGYVYNCLNVGSVVGKSDTGGICGETSRDFEGISNCSQIFGGIVEACYFEDGKVTVDGIKSNVGVGKNSRTDEFADGVIINVKAKTAAELASGETAYLLNEILSKDESETFRWKQNIDEGTADDYPKFTGGTVYKTADESECTGYTNCSDGMKQHSEGTERKCKWCGKTLTIPVTVSGITAADKIYDGTAAATLNFDAVNISGAENGAKLSVTAKGTFADANAGENKTVTITELELSGDDADKYSIAETGQQTSTTASISKKVVTVVVTVSDKDYDGNTSATVSASVNSSDIYSGDKIEITGLVGSFDDENVGTDKNVTLTKTGEFAVTGDGSTNYELTLPQTAKGNIKALSASVSAFNDKEERYSGNPIKHEISGTHIGIKSIKYSYIGKDSTIYSESENAPTAVGTYTVRASFTMEKGYAQLEPLNSTLTINKAEQTVTAENVSGIYGDTDKFVIANGIGRLTYEVTAGTDVAEIDSATGKLSFKKAGEATVKVSAEGDSNHERNTTNVTVTVGKKTVTVKAKNKKLPLNSQTPDLSSPMLDTDYEIIGRIGNDVLSPSVIVTLSCEPDMGSTGDYEIVLTVSGTDERYELATENGTLNVYKKSSGGGAVVPTVPKNDEVGADEKTDHDTETTEQAQAETLAKLKDLIGKITLTARSEKTAKNSIKVTLKIDKESAEAIETFKKLGYTVKYKYYRSTKKSSGYKAMLTKTSKTYVNTSGVKSTKYYYKVQIRVYDENGKCVAKTALKQCKYACRQWT